MAVTLAPWGLDGALLYSFIIFMRFYHIYGEDVHISILGKITKVNKHCDVTHVH